MCVFMEINNLNYRYESFLFSEGFPLLALEHEMQLYFAEVYVPIRANLEVEMKSFTDMNV